MKHLSTFKEQVHCTYCLQEECLINKYCSKKWKEEISKSKSMDIFQKGQHVFSENSKVFGVYFIYNGKVKVFNSGGNGKTHIIRFAGSGELLGMRAFSDHKYRVSCSALEDTSACFIDKKTFVQSLRENSEMALELIQIYAKTLSLMEMRQKHLAQFCVNDRIAEALIIIKKKFGKTTEEGILLDVYLSRKDIADFAGTAVAVAIRTLAWFKKAHIIDFNHDKKIVILDLSKLLDMILNNYSNPYQQECCEIIF